MSEDEDNNNKEPIKTIGSYFSGFEFKEIQDCVKVIKEMYLKDTKTERVFGDRKPNIRAKECFENLRVFGIQEVSKNLYQYDGMLYSSDDIINNAASSKLYQTGSEHAEDNRANSEWAKSKNPLPEATGENSSKAPKGPTPVFEEKPPTEPSIEPIPESIDTPVVLPEAKPAENLTPTDTPDVVLPPEKKPAKDTVEAKPTDNNLDVVLPKAIENPKSGIDTPDVVLPRAKPKVKDASSKVKVKEKPKKNDPTTAKPKTAPTATPPASQSASAKPKTEKSSDSEFSSRHSKGWMPGDQYNKMPERWKNNTQKASLLAERDKTEQLFRQEKQHDDEKTDKDQSLETGETELKRLSNAPDNDKETVRIEALTKQIDKAKTQKETEQYLAKEGKNLTPQEQNALLTPSSVEANKPPATQERHKKEKAEEKLKQEEKLQKANKSTPPLAKDSIPNSPLKEGIENSKSGKSKTQKAPKQAQMNSSNNNKNKIISSTTIETGGDISTYNTEELFMKYNHENYNCC